MDLGKKVKHGVEPEPIEAPAFTPVRRESEGVPGFAPDFTPVTVPVHSPQRQS